MNSTTSHDATHSASATHREGYHEASGWVGWIAFGSFMMMLLGIFHAIAGLVGIFQDNFYAVRTGDQLLLFSVETWGWIHLIAGSIVFLAGLSLLSGALWARIITVLLASLSAIAYLTSITLYPIWSVIGITLAVLVIYAVTVHGRELTDEYR